MNGNESGPEIQLAWDECCDFLIVGSGAASVPAALAVLDAGKRPLIVEKTDKFGGSTALSGGVVWAPNNPVMKRKGIKDSAEMAKAYLDACAGPHAPGSTAERRQAFLADSPHLVAYLEGKGMKWVHAAGWSDYHAKEYPGGVAESRSLVAQIFDLRELGAWADRLRASARPPLRLYEASALFLYGRTLKSRLTMIRLGWRLMLNRLGRRLVGTGMAVQGRLLKIALRNEAPIWLNSPLVELVQEGDRVTGAIIERDGRRIRVQARDGVLLNAGGFAHDQAMRDRYHPQPSSVAWTMSNAGDTGEVIRMAEALGAELGFMDLSWYNSISVHPDGAKAGNVMDISKPHAIVVDAGGERFVNESCSYVQFGLAVFERQKTRSANPSFFVFDSQHRNHYLVSGQKPGRPPGQWIESGYLFEASSLDELAAKCGIDPNGLKKTVERFNAFARTGVDEDFRRGWYPYNNFLGDPANRPNPNLGTIEKPPFYGIKIYQGDVGTAGGVVADEHARVLRRDGSVIPGLYVTGNSAAPVVGRSYPGAGASIGASMVFGWRAARHAMGVNA